MRFNDIYIPATDFGEVQSIYKRFSCQGRRINPTFEKRKSTGKAETLQHPEGAV